MEFLNSKSANRSGLRVWDQIKKRRLSKPAQSKIRNRLEMTVMLLDKSARDTGTKLRLGVGNLSNDPAAKLASQSGARYLEFPVDVSEKTKPHMPAEYNATHELREHSVYTPKIDSNPNVSTGSILRIQSISFAHFWYEKVSKLLYLEKIDRATLCQGLEPDLLSEAVLQMSHKPFEWITSEGVQKVKDGTANFSAEYATKLGSTLHALSHYHDEDETRYESEQGTCMNFKLFGKEIKYVDNVFNNKLQTSIPSQCFKTLVDLCQWSGSPLANTTPNQRREVTVHLNIYDAALSIFRIQDLDAWCLFGPVIMRHFNYTVLALENMEETSKYPENFADEQELPDDASPSLDMDVKCLAILCNVPREVRRVGLKVPDEAVLQFLGLTKESPQLAGEEISQLDAKNYHTTMNTTVLNMMESTRNVSELIEQGQYEFFAVTTASLSSRDYDMLNSDLMPQDSLYMLLIPEFVALCAKLEMSNYNSPSDANDLEKMFGLKIDNQRHNCLVKFATKIGDNLSFMIYAVAKEQLLMDAYLTEENLTVVSHFVPFSKDEIREKLAAELVDMSLKQNQNQEEENEKQQKESVATDGEDAGSTDVQPETSEVMDEDADDAEGVTEPNTDDDVPAQTPAGSKRPRSGRARGANKRKRKS